MWGGKLPHILTRFVAKKLYAANKNYKYSDTLFNVGPLL